MAKGDNMPNASVGVGYNPNAGAAGPMNPTNPTGQMGRFPPMQAPSGGGVAMGMGNPGQGVGPSNNIFQMLMQKFAGMGMMPQGQPFQQMQGQMGMARPSAMPMAPRPGGVGPSFAQGSTFNRPQVQPNRAME